MDEETKKLIKGLYYLSTVGLSMALAIAIGAGIGYYEYVMNVVNIRDEPLAVLCFFGLWYRGGVQKPAYDV